MYNDTIILADLHLHHLPLWRFDWNNGFLNSLLAQSEGKDLILLGDVFESRDRLDSTVSNQFIKFIYQWPKESKIYWLTGQHDSYLPGKATLGALQYKNDNLVVIDNDVYHDDKFTDRYFVPFARKDKDYRKLLSKVPDDVIVFTHLPTVEAIAMFSVSDKQGISVKEFCRFRHTYSGDIHKYHDFNKFSYIGATSQRDWRDKNTVGVYGIIAANNEFKRIKTNHPVHIDLTKDGQVLPKNRKCIVKTKRGHTVKADNIICSMETTDINIQSIKFKSNFTEDYLIDSYINNNPLKSGISGKYIKTFANNILRECKNEKK